MSIFNGTFNLSFMETDVRNGYCRLKPITSEESVIIANAVFIVAVFIVSEPFNSMMGD
jgi:hypothetical protein